MIAKKILILDDDQTLLDMLGEVLTESRNYIVHTLSHTTDIFKTIGDFVPDIIILDYLMYNLNGGELCAAIKRNPLTACIPVIILTAFPKVMLSLGTYGCDVCLSKPFDLEELESEISILLVMVRD